MAQMSLRKMAKAMGITPAYLSMMVNGKRPWRADSFEQYCGFVNSVNNNQASMSHSNEDLHTRSNVVNTELDLAGARGSRTHRPNRRARTIGVEVRGTHRSTFAPAMRRLAARRKSIAGQAADNKWGALSNAPVNYNVLGN